jgi:hypothetical protein
VPPVPPPVPPLEVVPPVPPPVPPEVELVVVVVVVVVPPPPVVVPPELVAPPDPPVPPLEVVVVVVVEAAPPPPVASPPVPDAERAAEHAPRASIARTAGLRGRVPAGRGWAIMVGRPPEVSLPAPAVETGERPPARFAGATP